MNKSEQFEKELLIVAARHCGEIRYYHGTKRTDLIAVNDKDMIAINISDLRDMLIDMHERSFEEGYMESWNQMRGQVAQFFNFDLEEEQ